MNHHTFSGTSTLPGNPQLYCFDLNTSAACIPKAGSPISNYPVKLGDDGIANPLIKRQIATSRDASSIVLNGKLYFPYSDCDVYPPNAPDPYTGCSTNVSSGGGIMCWDLTADKYCTGGGLNARGQIRLHTHNLGETGQADWFIAGNVYATTYDIKYYAPQNELYTLANDGSIACYSLNLGAPCPGQPYATPITNHPGYRIEGNIEIVNNKIYAVMGPAPHEIGCIDLISKTQCTNFTTIRDVSVELFGNDFNSNTALVNINNNLCVFLSGSPPSPDVTGIYCYDELLDTWIPHFPLTHSATLFPAVFHLHDQEYPGRLYIPVTNSTKIYCFDTTTESECPGWIGGVNAANSDGSLYSIHYTLNCLWATSDSGHVYPINPIDGSVCNPLYQAASGTGFTTLDASTYFCSTPHSQVNWDKLIFNDGSTTPSPSILTAHVWDLSQCTIGGPSGISCSGSPIKSQNLLLNSGHGMDISDISFVAHPALAVTIDFTYSDVPTPTPTFYFQLNQTNQPEMCLKTQLVFSGAICSSPITLTCGNSNIIYASDPNSTNNNSQSCLNVETYFGKDPTADFCFVDLTGKSVFKVTNPNAGLAPPGTIFTGDLSFFGKGNGSGTTGGGGAGNGGGIVEILPGGQVNVQLNQAALRQTIENIGNSTPLIITSLTAAGVATVLTTSIVTSTANIGNIFGVFLGFLAARRKKYWGIVSDEATGAVIPFASITLTKKELDSKGQVRTIVISQTVTDLEGRYRLNTDQRDNFFLEVRASGYEIYYKFLKMDNPLSSLEDIVYDVQLKKTDARTRNSIVSFLGYQKKNLFALLKTITLISSIIGFLVTMYLEINSPSILNLIFIALYVLMFTITLYPLVYEVTLSRSYVLERQYKTRIRGAVVRIYDDKQQLGLSITNGKGEVRFDLNPGTYGILANKKGYEMTNEKGEQGRQKLMKAHIKAEGYLDKNIEMIKQTGEETPSTGILENPFSEK